MALAAIAASEGTSSAHDAFMAFGLGALCGGSVIVVVLLIALAVEAYKGDW